MKTMQKRGLSDIITTVLIILLAIAAVVMIWSFIKKPIEQGGTQIQASSDCFALKIVPKSCVLYNSTTASGKDMANVTAQWAEGTAKPTKVKLVITGANGLNNVTEVNGPASVLETTAVTPLNVSKLTGTLVFTAVGEIQASDGTIVPCTSSTQESLTCT